jgi:hypothetical protein
MMLPLVTFEAQSLRSHAPDFLIEHSNLVIEGLPPARAALLD